MIMDTQQPSSVTSPRSAGPSYLTVQTNGHSSPTALPQHMACSSPRPVRSPVFFQAVSPTMQSYPQSISPPVSFMHTSPHHYTAQHSPMSRCYSNSTIFINPAGVTPCGFVSPATAAGHYTGMSTPNSSAGGYSTPGRCTPGVLTPGRCTPVYAMTMKKKYVDIMLASSASTVAIDNKIEQAMDLVKSHLMLAVREEVDVLKERIGELMERINHLEYENSVLKKYATPETLQQIQHSGSNP